MFMSFVFLVLVKSASAVVRARASAALWGSALVNRTCSTGGQANFLLPELVAGTRIVFPALVGKTVERDQFSWGEQGRSKIQLGTA